MRPSDPDRETHIDTTDARAGSNEGVVRWVLLISLTLAIVALSAIWITGALSEGQVEEEGTTEGRQREAEEAASGESSIDGITTETGDRVSEDDDAVAGE